jgi:hypothetical protein
MKNISRPFLTAVLALLIVVQAGYIFWPKSTTETAQAPSETACDVGSLCLQKSTNEGGVYGVAQIEAHYVGQRSFTIMGNDTVSCSMMAIDNANDPRVTEEVGSTESGDYLFAIPDEDVVRFRDTTAQAPASLTVYISERTGRDTSPCSSRVHIVN